MGASAGGIEPLQQFLPTMPTPSGPTYVVVQHRDPTRKAMLGESCSVCTSMVVREATEASRIEPDAVFVIPPYAGLTVGARALHMTAPSKPRGQRLPIVGVDCWCSRMTS